MQLVPDVPPAENHTPNGVVNQSISLSASELYVVIVDDHRRVGPATSCGNRIAGHSPTSPALLGYPQSHTTAGTDLDYNV